MPFEFTPEVGVGKDDQGHIRRLSHPLRPFGQDKLAADWAGSPRALADAYLREIQPALGLPSATSADFVDSWMAAAAQPESDLRFKEEKRLVDTAAVTYAQARFGIPLWNAGVTVRVRMQPMGVMGASNDVHFDVGDLQPPTQQARYLPDKIDEAGLARLFPPGVIQNHSINGKHLWVYRHDPQERLDPESRPKPPRVAFEQGPPTLPLFDLPVSLRAGEHYVVSEVLFTMPLEGWGRMHWRAFVEVDTGAVLYLRALVACVGSGSVFLSDPVTLRGPGHSAQAPDAMLDAARTQVPLSADPPPGPTARCELQGPLVKLVNTSPPGTAPPSEAAPFHFHYSAKSPDFAAVSAYYHCDAIFRMIEGMGIPLADYFDGTQFPVPVDHDAMSRAVNARAPGNAQGNGSGGFQFGAAASGTTVGIAVDPRVVWHEFGHALLWDHVGSPNFGFAHSPGDALAAILHAPQSRSADPAETFPFMQESSGLSRRHDRDVAQGWAWGGPATFDDRQYGSEQILSTTLFRVYLACGGGDADLPERQFAARYVAYLIIKAVGLLSFTTRDPQVYVDALMEADASTANFEGHPGGAVHKVIRWSFEKQGLYQPPGAPQPVMRPGAPPEVDVYIDDDDGNPAGGRRGGEYMPYLSNCTASPSIWNRHAADGGHQHQAPRAGEPEFLYVAVGNRGTLPAAGVRVTAAQAPASKSVWDGTWTQLAAPAAVASTVAAGGRVVVGPIAWTPAGNRPLVLASVSATGDPSNLQSIVPPVALARLVRGDNNVAARAM